MQAFHTFLFGYATALEIYRTGGPDILNRRRMEVDITQMSTQVHALKGTGWLEWAEGRLHAIVGTRAAYRRSTHLVTHYWGDTCRYWPAWQLTDDVYVSSPEFLFLQLAGVLDEPELIFVGCELCGCYYYDDQDDIQQRKPLTSKARIEQFLKEHTGTNGHQKARRALRYVIDNSGSPMETALALVLTLPCKQGGHGITLPVLNKTIPLGPVATAALGRDYITPDLLWEKARLAVEYESDEYHTGADRITNDSRRRLALEATGYEVITVTNTQMRSIRELDALATHVAHKTGKRKVKLSQKAAAAQVSLANRLRRLAIDPCLTTGE